MEVVESTVIASPLFQNLRDDEVFAIRLRRVRQRGGSRQGRSHFVVSEDVGDVGDVRHRHDSGRVEFVEQLDIAST